VLLLLTRTILMVNRRPYIVFVIALSFIRRVN